MVDAWTYFFIEYSRLKYGIKLSKGKAEEILGNSSRLSNKEFKKVYENSSFLYKDDADQTQAMTKVDLDIIYSTCKKLLNPNTVEIEEELNRLKEIAKGTESKANIRTRASTRTNIIVILIIIYIFIFIKGLICYYVTEVNPQNFEMKRK